LQGKTLILDDVITAGTSVRESVEIINNAGAQAVGVLIALDRQEKGWHNKSAVQEVRESYSIPVFSIISLTDIIEFLEQERDSEVQLTLIRAYRQRYGI